MPRQRKRDGVYWRKDRRKYWMSYIDETGERQREPSSVNHDEAMDLLRERQREVKERKNLKPGEVVASSDSFSIVADRFLAYQQPRLTARSLQRETGIVRHLKGFFVGKLTEITSGGVSDYVTVRLGAVSKSSVRKEVNTLKHLFRLAYDEWELLPESHPNPTRKIKLPKFRDERTQHLSPDQFRRVLGASPEKMRPIFALLTATGMRRSELVYCQWKYVDGSRILLPTSKNDEPKEVHLNAYAQQVLASIPQGGPEDRLFPGVSPESVSVAFHEVCLTLGIADIRLHDLRHTFATWLRRQGTELDVIAAQLGHRDLRMTKRYARIASTQVRQAVNGLDSMFGVVEETEAVNDSHALPTGSALLPEASSLPN